MVVIVIVNSKLLKRHSKAKRRASAYSRALRHIRGVFQRIVRGRLRSGCQKINCTDINSPVIKHSVMRSSHVILRTSRRDKPCRDNHNVKSDYSLTCWDKDVTRNSLSMSSAPTSQRRPLRSPAQERRRGWRNSLMSRTCLKSSSVKNLFYIML